MSEKGDEEDHPALRLAADAMAQNIALQSVCAILMANIAILCESPPDKLAEMVGGLQGMAHGLASVAGTDNAALSITRAIDKVCELAEAALAKGQNRRTGV